MDQSPIRRMTQSHKDICKLVTSPRPRPYAVQCAPSCGISEILLLSRLLFNCKRCSRPIKWLINLLHFRLNLFPNFITSLCLIPAARHESTFIIIFHLHLNASAVNLPNNAIAEESQCALEEMPVRYFFYTDRLLRMDFAVKVLQLLHYRMCCYDVRF